MSIKKSTIKGFKNGIDTTIMLSRILIPVYFLVTFLKYTPILKIIANLFEPLMKIFGLPGEAALVFVLGNCINLYAAIGAIKVLNLSVHQITTIALMLSFSHSLIVETAIIRKMEIKGSKAIAIRMLLAIISGGVMGLIGRG